MRGSILETMKGDQKTQTEDLDLNKLEFRIDELIGVCDHLKEENRLLRDEREMLASERASLLEKNEQVRQRVENMISRLRAMEKGV